MEYKKKPLRYKEEILFDIKNSINQINMFQEQGMAKFIIDDRQKRLKKYLSEIKQGKFCLTDKEFEYRKNYDDHHNIYNSRYDK
jgi:hypothetical protein